jgi:hypothetical protein
MTIFFLKQDVQGDFDSFENTFEVFEDELLVFGTD